MKSLRALACVLALALPAGCGSGAQKAAHRSATASRAPTGGRLTTAQFIKRGNAICTAYYKRLDTIPPPTSRRRIEAGIQRSNTYLEQALVQLGRLRPPAGDKRTLAKIISLARATEPLSRRLIGAIERKDKAAIRRLNTRGDALDARANELSARLGLYVCAEPMPKVSSGKG